MVVVMANTTAGVRRRTEGFINGHGERTLAELGEVTPMFPARTKERSDGGWSIALDPILWPVRTGDHVITDEDQQFVVTATDLVTNNVAPDVDYVRIVASQRTDAGTEPGGAWFVARTIDPSTIEPPEGTEPVYDGHGLWTGYGPPPVDLPGNLGDEYVDVLTGHVYLWGP